MITHDPEYIVPRARRAKPDPIPPVPPARMPPTDHALAWLVAVCVAILVAASAALSFVGCTAHAASPVDATRANARAAVLTVAEATKQADAVCASTARAKSSVELASRCDVAYTAIRASLVGMSTAIDGWTSVASGQETVICVVNDAAQRLAVMLADIANVDPSVALPIAADAYALVAVLGSCHMGDAGHE